MAEDDRNALAWSNLIIGHINAIDLCVLHGGHLAGERGHDRVSVE